MKKRWSANEDSKLAQLVGNCNFTRTKWTELSRQMENCTANQCRDRYSNSLKLDGKKVQWTKEEDENIFLVAGGVWQQIEQNFLLWVM